MSTSWAKPCLPRSARCLQEQGMKVGTGTIVDATIISAPSSTKNADKASATPRCTRPARASSGTSA
jgi:hypothetical protein